MGMRLGMIIYPDLPFKIIFFQFMIKMGSGLANLDLDQDVIANPYTDIKAQ